MHVLAHRPRGRDQGPCWSRRTRRRFGARWWRVRSARRGGANLQAVGELEVEKVLHDVMEEAIGDLDVRPAAICLGIAGVDRPEDARVVRGIMKRIGYKARVLVVNDALIALVAGAGDAPGIVVIAGTGSIAYGRNGRFEAARRRLGLHARRRGQRLLDRQGRAARGPARGGQAWARDEAHRAAAELLRRRPRAGPHSPGLSRHAAPGGDCLPGAVRPERLHRRGSGRHRYSARVRRPARIVRALGRQAPGAGRMEFPFVLSGGIFRAVPWLEEELSRRLPLASPRSRTMLLNVEPARGAVRLALAEARGGYTFRCIRQTRPSPSPSSQLASSMPNAQGGMLKVTVFKDERTLAKTLAAEIAATLKTTPDLVFGLPTGRTPVGLYPSSAPSTPTFPRRRPSTWTSSWESSRTTLAAIARSCSGTCSHASTSGRSGSM